MVLDKDLLIRMYRTMLKIRCFEEAVSLAFKNMEAFGFAHLSIGQEAIACGVGLNLCPDDFIATNHRGHGHLIAKGADIKKMMAEIYGREAGYCKGKGGSMHICDAKIGIIGANGIVGAWNLLADGVGLATQLRKGNQVTVVFSGDDSTNIGYFHEAVNFAAVKKLPVVFICENNRYGVTTHISNHSAVKKISQKAKAYGIEGKTIDGQDVMKVYLTVKGAIEKARNGQGPAFIECLTYRWRGHYEGDPDDYRRDEEKEEIRKKCPIKKLRKRLIKEGVATTEELETLEEEVKKEVEEAVSFASTSPEPPLISITQDVYSAEEEEVSSGIEPTTPSQMWREIPYSFALREALAEEMRRDERVFILGEDVQYGFFGVTRGLVEEFGEDRVIDTPLSESAIVGSAVGAAMVGMRPVAEIMFADFLTVCMDAVVNQAAKLRYMSGGQFQLPLVIRSAGGAGLSFAAQHSQSLEAIFMHIPGLIIVAPSSAYEAKGLLKSAIRSNNPVLFFEHKLLYFVSAKVPEEEYLIPIGRAKVLREGKDVTVVAIQSMVSVALNVAQKLAKEGIEVEVIDPRTLVPLDKQCIMESVKKTGRLVIIEEGHLTLGVGAEIVALVCENVFSYLKAPVQRIAAPDTPVPFSRNLEYAFIPSAEKLKQKIMKVIEGK